MCTPICMYTRVSFRSEDNKKKNYSIVQLYCNNNKNNFFQKKKKRYNNNLLDVRSTSRIYSSVAEAVEFSFPSESNPPLEFILEACLS